MTEQVPVLTIDGPGGAGKGTISGLMADRLNWHLLDSGALYRLTAQAAVRHQVALDDEAALAELAQTLDVAFPVDNGQPRTLLEGDDVSWSFVLSRQASVLPRWRRSRRFVRRCCSVSVIFARRRD